MCIGNLTVGGTGKTPLAQWVARLCLRRGLRAAILLRGYGRDEAALHRSAVPGALVVADPNRPRAARRAVAEGAGALILDDGFQRFDLQRDLDVVLVSADAADAAPWPLPAGPWREPWSALFRADVVVVTRKAATDEAVDRTLDRVGRLLPGGTVSVVRLDLGPLEGLHSGRPVPPDRLAGRRVLAVAGVGDPRAFGRQLRALGATVALAARPDHYRYPGRDVRRLRDAAAQVDYVVVTAKDAVKLRSCWPAGDPEPLVAGQRITWERGRAPFEATLAHVFTAGGGRHTR